MADQMAGEQPHDNRSEQVEFFTFDNNAAIAPVFTLLLQTLAEYTPTQSDQQLLSYYLSTLACVMPEAGEIAQVILPERGATLIEIRLPSQAAEYILIIPAVVVSAEDIMLYFAQLTFILYKKINTAVDYQRFMTRRMNALSSIVYRRSVTELSILLDFEHADRIRRVAGSDWSIRNAVLNLYMTLQEGNNRFARLADYFLKIIEYTGMGNLCLITEELVLCKSPVLNNGAVRTEVFALARAIERVAQSSEPHEFFCITCNSEDYRLLARTNFPTLINVASKIRQKRITTTSHNFRIPETAGMASLVESLVRLHESQPSMDADFINAYLYLTQFAELPEEPSNPVSGPLVESQTLIDAHKSMFIKAYVYLTESGYTTKIADVGIVELPEEPHNPRSGPLVQ